MNLKLFESETIQSKLNEQIRDYFINFFENNTLEFSDEEKNVLILGQYFSENYSIEKYDQNLKEWYKLYYRFTSQLNHFKNEHDVELVELKNEYPFGIKFSLVKKSKEILFKCDYYYVDSNNNIFFDKEKLISFCSKCGLNSIKINLEKWSAGYILEIKSLNSYSRIQLDAINKIKELFIEFEKYKKYNYISYINIRNSFNNKPVELNIDLKEIDGDYFLI